MKLVPFKSLDVVYYSPSIVTMAVSVAVCEIASDKESCYLENEVRHGPLQCVTTLCRSLSSFDADVHKRLYSLCRTKDKTNKCLGDASDKSVIGETALLTDC